MQRQLVSLPYSFGGIHASAVLLKRMQAASNNACFQAPTQTDCRHTQQCGTRWGGIFTSRFAFETTCTVMEGLYYATNLKSADWESYFVAFNQERMAAYCSTVSQALRAQ
jgi:hypothetical protein